VRLEDTIDIQGPLQVRVSGQQYFAEQERNPSPAVQRLYQLVREHRETYRVGS
jgi:hypothetical protein